MIFFLCLSLALLLSAHAEELQGYARVIEQRGVRAWDALEMASPFRLVRLTFSSDRPKPSPNWRIRVFGEREETSFRVQSWSMVGEEHSRENSAAQPLMPKRGLSARPELFVRVAIVTTPSQPTMCTQSKVNRWWSEQQWSLARYFRSISQSFGTELRLVSVESVALTRDYANSGNNLESCEGLISETFNQLSSADPNVHTLMLLPSRDTGCNVGASPIACWPCFSTAFADETCEGISLPIHEMLHALGLFHSNALVEGRVLEYGDGSCQMGASLGGFGASFQRKGISAPQLRRLGIILPNQVEQSAEIGITFTLAHAYFESTTALKIFQVGREEISFRTASDFGIDHHVNVSAGGRFGALFNPGNYASYSDAVFVHRQAPGGIGGIVLTCVLRPGEQCATETSDTFVRFHFANETHASVSLVNSTFTPRPSPLGVSDPEYLLYLPRATDVLFHVAHPDLDPVFLEFDLDRQRTLVSAELIVEVDGGDYDLNVIIGGLQFPLRGTKYELRDEVTFDLTNVISNTGRLDLTTDSNSLFRFFSGVDCQLEGFGYYYCMPRLRVKYANVDILPADLNFDGRVDLLDLILLIENWGLCDCAFDLTGDGAVSLLDILAMLDSWSGV